MKMARLNRRISYKPKQTQHGINSLEQYFFIVLFLQFYEVSWFLHTSRIVKIWFPVCR